MPARCCCRGRRARCSIRILRRAVAEPAGVLGKIAPAKREELAHRFDGVSLDALRARARPARRSLTATLALNGARFLLEIKPASPSRPLMPRPTAPAATPPAHSAPA